MHFLQLLLVAFLTTTSSALTTSQQLQQPSCLDSGPRALHLFALNRTAHECALALTNSPTNPSSSSTVDVEVYTNLTLAITEFDAQYSRYCRWNRLTESPPAMQFNHFRVFRPVQKAFEGVASAHGAGQEGVCGQFSAAVEGDEEEAVVVEGYRRRVREDEARRRRVGIHEIRDI